MEIKNVAVYISTDKWDSIFTLIIYNIFSSSNSKTFAFINMKMTIDYFVNL